MAEDHTIDELTMPVPDVEELYQEDDGDPRIPVRLELGTVYRLPARRAVLSTDTAPVVGGTPVCVAPGNTKRNRLTLVSATEAIYISNSSMSLGSYWPAGVPYTVEHADSVFVRSAHASNTTLVGCTQELWAD